LVLCAAFASPPPERPAARHRIESARLERTVSPSIPRHPHQRRDDFPRASARDGSALRLATACDARCVRPTSASQHIHYEHPRLARFPSRRAAAERAAFHDATTRFSGRKNQRRGAFSSPRRASHRASGTPVASRFRPAFPLPRSRPSSVRQDRFDPMPRERHRAPATRGTFHRRVPSSSCRPVDRLRPRVTELDVCRSRDFAITIRRSAFLRSHPLASVPLGNLGSRVFARPRPRESMFG